MPTKDRTLTSCPSGHPASDRYESKSGRIRCKSCLRANNQKARARRQAKHKPPIPRKRKPPATAYVKGAISQPQGARKTKHCRRCRKTLPMAHFASASAHACVMCIAVVSNHPPVKVTYRDGTTEVREASSFLK